MYKKIDFLKLNAINFRLAKYSQMDKDKLDIAKPILLKIQTIYFFILNHHCCRK